MKDTEEVVRAAYEQGRAAWPRIELPFETFAEMARTAGGRARLDCWPGDFFLACAAGLGIGAAITTIDRDHLMSAASRIRRLGASSDDVDEALQVAREILFVRSPPRIRSYAASAPLRQWIQVVALRTAIDLHRRVTPEKNADCLDDAEPAPPLDPVRLMLRTQFQAAVDAALSSELTGLPARVRTILRLHFVEGLSIDQLAARSGVHRITVARWIWGAADQVFEGVRRHLIDRVGVADQDCESIMRLLCSQVSLDLSRILRE